MVTIKEIADRAGVSRGTVDRVLNNRGKVNPEKEERVRRIAQELGYKPNVAGKGLAARKKHLKLGFICVDDEFAPFFTDVLKGAEKQAEELKQYGVEVLFFITRIEELMGEECLERIVSENAMDGWVINGVLSEHFTRAMKSCGREPVPVIFYNMDEPGADRMAYVGCDYEKSGRLAAGVAALMTDGKARVGVVSVDDGTISSFKARMEGFHMEISERYPEMSVVSQQVMTREKAQFDFFVAVQGMVERHPEINILYLVNPGDYSICQAIRKASTGRDIKIISNDLVEKQRQMVKDGVIAATICQEPEKQGALPLELLFNYLALGMEPTKEYYFTELSIRISQNV